MSGPELSWDAHGVPYSVHYDDKYFCNKNGYEDALNVMCKGNRLSERFQALDPARPGTFIILETGFGTGLSFCCTWRLWRERAPRSWRLHFISIEKFPLSAAQLHQALCFWPIVMHEHRSLTAAYPKLLPGITQLHLGNGRIALTVVVADVVEALAMIKEQGIAAPGPDAIFLHGFAPSRNPDMWNDQVYAGLARVSGPHTTLATFTAAGHVRRGLEAQGFHIQKEQGYGGKKDMLTGQYLAFR